VRKGERERVSERRRESGREEEIDRARRGFGRVAAVAGAAEPEKPPFKPDWMQSYLALRYFRMIGRLRSS
jgi:hypothetical protein